MADILPKLRFAVDDPKTFRFKLNKTAAPAALATPVDEESSKILETVQKREEDEAHIRTLAEA